MSAQHGRPLAMPPLYHAIMVEICAMMAKASAEALTVDETILLDALVGVAEVYERCDSPGWLLSQDAQRSSWRGPLVKAPHVEDKISIAYDPLDLLLPTTITKKEEK